MVSVRDTMVFGQARALGRRRGRMQTRWAADRRARASARLESGLRPAIEATSASCTGRGAGRVRQLPPGRHRYAAAFFTHQSTSRCLAVGRPVRVKSPRRHNSVFVALLPEHRFGIGKRRQTEGRHLKRRLLKAPVRQLAVCGVRLAQQFGRHGRRGSRAGTGGGRNTEGPRLTLRGARLS